MKICKLTIMFNVIFILLIILITKTTFAQDSLNVELINQIDIVYSPAIIVQNDYAYILNYEFGMRVFDVSQPSEISEIGSISISGSIQDMYIIDNYAYIAAGDNGLRVINIANPTAMYEIGSYTGCKVNFVECDTITQRAYLTSWDSDCIKILDITTPSSPSVLGTYSHPVHKVGCADGDYIYVCEDYYNGNGFRVIDVSTPSNPTQVGRKNTGSNPCEISKIGDYCYLADDCDGVRVIDVSTPSSPSEVAHWTAGQTYSVHIVDNMAFVVDLFDGLFMLDISSPASPVEVGYYGTTWSLEKVFKSTGDDYIYALSSSSLYIYESMIPTVVLEEDNIPLKNDIFSLNCYPNPFNPNTSIKYSLTKSSKVNLQIYNLRGELVRTLVDENKTIGNYNITWNGTDDAGLKVSSGVYIYTLTSDYFTSSKKMILLK